MWLCTSLGFFSIVKKGQPNTWQIRSRTQQDLENLISAAGLKTDVIHTPQGDYAFRAVVDRKQRDQVFAVLADSVDYPNFKDRVAELPDQRKKLEAYHSFWAGMFKLQVTEQVGRHPRETSETGRFARRQR